MTNKEFAFKYAGDRFMLDDDTVILVGYRSGYPETVIVSPTERYAGEPWYWDVLDSMDVITYKANIRAYLYVNLNEIIPICEEEPRPAPEVKPMTPGECIAYYEGRQGMNYSVINGSVSAMYKGQGGALQLVSRGEGTNDVAEKVWGRKQCCS